jgi:hypothetical protein
MHSFFLQMKQNSSRKTAREEELLPKLFLTWTLHAGEWSLLPLEKTAVPTK